MIPHGVGIFAGLEPIDVCWGFERLEVLVQERLGRQTRSGALCVFFGKRRTALKVLFYDSGVGGRRHPSGGGGVRAGGVAGRAASRGTDSRPSPALKS
jgi:hypothetical protein